MIPGQSEVFVPWGDQERQIFRFHDGAQERAIDPLPTLRRLQQTPGLSLENDMALAAAAGAGGEFAVEGDKAIERLVDATRKAFSIPPLTLAADKSTIGLTEPEVLGLLTAFGKFIGRLQEAARPLANSPPTTDSAASANSTTPPGSDSISTGTLPSSDAPPNLPPASP